MTKSLTVAYLLWAIGGLFGLHHLYLHRDRHCLIYWLTFGGYFGCLWIRDLWRLPEYVKDFNEDDEEFMTRLSYTMKIQRKPESGLVRICGQIIVADILGYLVMSAVPYEYFIDQEILLSYIYALTVPVACAIGIHLVGNVGRHKGSFLPTLIGAFITAPLYIYLGSNSVFWTSIAASIAFNKFSKKWRRSYPNKKSLPQRMATLTFFAIFYLSLYASWFYFNCSIVEKHGEDQKEETIKCRDAAVNFWRSPAFVDFRRTMADLWTFVKIHGYKGLKDEIIKAFDPLGEANALKVLNVTEKASQDEITSAYRKLAREWHPDRHKDPIKKSEAQEKFIEIQQAYEVLSRSKSKRMVKNKKDRDNIVKTSQKNDVKEEL